MIDMVPLMWLHLGFRRRDSWICSLLPWQTGPGMTPAATLLAALIHAKVIIAKEGSANEATM
jgi:hypothetical protein